MSASSPTARPFAPQFIENKLKFSPFIREAVAFGDQRPFVAAMIAIDMQTVGKWAEKQGLAYTSYHGPQRQAGGRGPDRRRRSPRPMPRLPDVQQVKRFLLLNKELDADDAEMTRTRKVRRRFVAEKYASVIDAFYGGKSQADVTLEITFEDGRKSTLSSTIAIHGKVAAEPARRAA